MLPKHSNLLGLDHGSEMALVACLVVLSSGLGLRL
jgi:hypothetical protein